MTPEATQWRLIYSQSEIGPFNTALENTILEEVSKGKSPPTLIFTEWKPTVSLGNAQNYHLDVDSEACKNAYKDKISIVRRLSGGQAVFLDEGYIVFSAIAPASAMHIEEKIDASAIRKNFCSVSIEALKNLGIPVEFYWPDNIIIKKEEKIRTLGNSGQVFKKAKTHTLEDNSSEMRGGYFLAQGSIRYKLTNFDMLINVLKINGQKLNNYGADIKEVLADVSTYNSKLTKEDFRNEFIKQFEKNYNAKLHEGILTSNERYRLKEKYLEEINIERIIGSPSFDSKGVCYFFVGGQNLVKSLEKYLHNYKPSTIDDSTIK